jgi:hypothetical protein
VTRARVASAAGALAAVAALALAPAARAQLGIDLSEPEPPSGKAPSKPAPERPEPPRPAATAPAAAAVPAPAPAAPPPAPVAAPKGTPAEAIAAADALLARRADDAALAYDAILRAPSFREVHARARLGLADALARAGLVRSALATLGEAVSGGPGEGFERAAQMLFELAGRTGDEHAVLAHVARLEGAELPAGAADRLHYLLAKWSYERAQALGDAGRPAEAKAELAAARRHAAKVKGGGSGARGDAFARARFLDALAQYDEGGSEGAVEALKEVVRLTNPRRTAAADVRLRELALLQLARIHYEHRQNRYAIFYYGRMPQAGESWLEGLWESSYAYYRLGDSERALGNLITLHSPYFQDEWFPESHLLKAIIYYENCRYPEARAIVEDFMRRFEPTHAALARLEASPEEPAEFLAVALDGGREGDPALRRRVARLATADGNVKRLTASIAELRREATAGIDARPAAFRDSALGRELRVRLGAERARLEVEAGARARHQIGRERAALRELLEQGLRVKIEVSRREREALEARIAGGRGPVVRDYRYSAAVSDEHLYWPYDGEFWRDELGTYAYTLTKGCRDAPGDVRVSR